MEQQQGVFDLLQILKGEVCQHFDLPFLSRGITSLLFLGGKFQTCTIGEGVRILNGMANHSHAST